MTTKQELIDLNTEFAQIIVESRTVAPTTHGADTGGGAALLFNPGALYGQAAVRLAGSEGPDTDNVTVSEFELLMRMTAAKIRAGDRTYIIESLLGQAVWLQSLSTQISTYMLKVNDKQKIALGGLLVKAQATAVKTLTALAGISSLG